jgi:hypothetical protein
VVAKGLADTALPGVDGINMITGKRIG